MITPMLVIDFLKIFKGLGLAKFIVQRAERYKFSDLPIVIVRGTKKVFKCLHFLCFSFSIEKINSSSQKGRLDGFKERVPYWVDSLPEIDSVHFNWSKSNGSDFVLKTLELEFVRFYSGIFIIYVVNP